MTETRQQVRNFGLITAETDPETMTARLVQKRYGRKTDQLDDAAIDNLKRWARATLEGEGYQVST